MRCRNAVSIFRAAYTGGTLRLAPVSRLKQIQQRDRGVSSFSSGDCVGGDSEPKIKVFQRYVAQCVHLCPCDG